jgi:hypothetical protein
MKVANSVDITEIALGVFPLVNPYIRRTGSAFYPTLAVSWSLLLAPRYSLVYLILDAISNGTLRPTVKFSVCCIMRVTELK